MTDNKHGYKAYDPGLVCRGYQYEEGKTYKKNGHGVCVGGVTHYCVNPFDVLNHYPLVRNDGKFSEFTTVEAIDEPVTDDGRKFATSTIKIGVKLGFAGFVKACIDFVYEKTIKNMPSDKVETGGSAQIGSSGGFAQIGSSGGFAQIGSSGDSAQIGSSGNFAKIDISGNTSVGAAIGLNSIIKGAVGNWITLAEWAYDSDKQRCAPVCVKSAQIDGEIIKADTWYKLADGEFVEVADE
jgi:hypothetical protein|nr:MAG TPA: hypothetical protein [Caudoviricetes sp.]